jgi:hypothetical protein
MKKKPIIRYATFAVEVSLDYLTDGGGETVEDGWAAVQPLLKRLNTHDKYGLKAEPVVSFEEWQSDENPPCPACDHDQHVGPCKLQVLAFLAIVPCGCLWNSTVPPDIDPDYEAARDAARDEATMDLHTIDLAHDLGVRDLTDPFTGETV